MYDAFHLTKKSINGVGSDNHLERINMQSVHFGSESIKTLGGRIWNLNPFQKK